MRPDSTAQGPAEPGAGPHTGGGAASKSLSSGTVSSSTDSDDVDATDDVDAADAEAKACCGCVHAPRRRKVLQVFGAALVCFAGGFLLGSMQGEAVG